MQDKKPVAQSSGMTLDDIYYVLFRHKWKIILCSTVSVLGAVTLFVVRPSPYQSEAKLLIRYVVDNRSLSTDGADSKVRVTDERGDNIIRSEVEILTSFDLAQQVVDTIGPERVLAKKRGGKERIATAALVNLPNLQLGSAVTGGKERLAAAALVNGNLTVEVPRRSSVIRIVFQHPNPELVQPVLSQLIDDYFKKHLEIHKTVGILDDFLTQETGQLRTHLAQIEQELGRLKAKAGVMSLADMKTAYAREVSKIRQELFDAEAELAERQATLKAVGETRPEKPESALTQEKVPTDKVDEYQRIRTRLDSLSKKEQTLLVEYTEESTLVKGVREQIAEAEKLKMNLEEQNPGLAMLGSRAPKTGGLVNAPSVDPAMEKARMITLETKIKVLNSQLDQVRSEVVNMAQLEAELTALQAKKELEEADYRSYSARLEQSRIDESLGADRITNISKIQSPSPPSRNLSKPLRTTVMLALGGVAIGLAWAFLTEFYLDSSVRHPKDIETKLQLPLFVSMPDVSRRKHRRAAGPAGNQTEREFEKLRLAIKSHEQLEGKVTATRRVIAGSEETGAWGRHALRPYFETLRDRLVFDFAARNLTDKPKLVAVTGADRGAGVTTVAAGLASCLAETGDGNVLLVDMHPDQDAARQFHKGKPVCGLDEALESETRSGALVQGRLYVVAEGSDGDRLSRISPKRFTDLLPKLKASGYDYIIFDMPPVSQTSVTARLAGVMDMTVFVIESERTDREIVRQASALLTESKASVCAVLNKVRTYAPPRRHQEFPSATQAGPIRRHQPSSVKPFAGSNG
jgi:uncharacterized protein involved in exopolysaccharide biosynthesis/Mrp family chromosome partitioning ATPase